MTFEERSVDLDPVLPGVLGVRLAATDAGSACFDAPAATMVVTHDAAVRLGLRTAAAQRIEAVALGFFGRTELIDELAVFKVAAALAVVMDGLTENLSGLVFRIELGELVEQKNLDENGAQPFGVRGQPGTLMTGVSMPCAFKNCWTP